MRTKHMFEQFIGSSEHYFLQLKYWIIEKWESMKRKWSNWRNFKWWISARAFVGTTSRWRWFANWMLNMFSAKWWRRRPRWREAKLLNSFHLFIFRWSSYSLGSRRRQIAVCSMHQINVRRRFARPVHVSARCPKGESTWEPFHIFYCVLFSSIFFHSLLIGWDDECKRVRPATVTQQREKDNELF